MVNLQNIAAQVKQQARTLGFADCRITDVDLGDAPMRLRQWLAQGMHGQMDYMEQHAQLRADPATLQIGCVRAVCVRIDYLPQKPGQLEPQGWQRVEWERLEQTGAAYVSLYARGRDYHKIVRQRLQILADSISAALPHQYRVFCDSAPVMEVELARKAGIGWRGKHTLALNREAGSMFFLGEILTDCPLPVDEPVTEHCGGCTACIDVCPTKAIVAPYVVDARRCISYLTIEHKGSIPEPLRPLMGNRIYGCDDCQLVCPWNKFAQATDDPDFAPRNGLDASTLLELFAWSEEEFNQRLQGSAIRRIGHARWLRNIAVALGNAAAGASGAFKQQAVQALRARAEHADVIVREHVQWALARY
ncbi:MAG: tRNA epoxyqueuosine(34) reductase QueG [Burkholderiaceae bacterium]